MLSESLEETSSTLVSYLTFRSGSTSFALDVSRVRFITSRDTLSTRSVPSRLGVPHEVFDYEKRPVPLYQFSGITRLRSSVDQSYELLELLKERKQDHINWVAHLEDSLKTGVPFTGALSPHDCAFGKWYDHFEADDEQLAEILARFDKPHKALHALAEVLMNQATEGDEARHAAVARLAEEKFGVLASLLELFDDAMIRMNTMTRPVVVIIESKGQLFAIQLDSIDGISEFSSGDWLDDREFEENACFDGYFQTKEGNLFLRIQPAQLLDALRSEGG